MESADAPLLVELVSQNLAVLRDAGYQLRKAEAVALHNEGMIMERIAGFFGVSRQRVSALLRRDDAQNGVYQPDVDHQRSYR